MRTAALALSPAVVLPFAASRLPSPHRNALELQDPPSLTLRIPHTDAPHIKVNPPVRPDPRLVLGQETALERLSSGGATSVNRRVARAEAYPPIKWHRGISEGLPYNGHLVDGTQLPVEGMNWVTWDPVTNSVPNAPERLYGTEHTIREVVSVIDAYRAAHPDAPRVVVGDISREGGGPMTDEHVSHQNGLDVDIYYPRVDGELRAPTTSSQIDLSLAQDLVDGFVAAGAQMIFVGFSTGLHGPSGVVVPYANHDYHMHVRFPPPG